jgi:hypothetical protein
MCAIFPSFPQKRLLQPGAQTKAVVARQEFHFQNMAAGQLSFSHPAKHPLKLQDDHSQLAFFRSQLPHTNQNKQRSSQLHKDGWFGSHMLIGPQKSKVRKSSERKVIDSLITKRISRGMAQQWKK